MAIRYLEIVKGTSDPRYPIDRGNALAAGVYVDSNDGFKLKYIKNGTVVTLLDDQTSGNTRLEIINPKAYAMGNAAAAISLFKVATVALTGFASGVLWYSYSST